MLALKVFRDKAAGMADLLPWAALVDNGIVQCKDGSFIAGWFYAAPDAITQTDEQRNYLTMRINLAMARLGTGWVSWHEAARMPANAYPAAERSHFPDPVTKAIDEERRQQFESEGAHYDTEFAVVVMYTPPSQIKSKLVDLIYDYGDEVEGNLYDKILAGFKQTLDILESSMGSVINLRRMGGYKTVDRAGREHRGDELLNFLQFCLTGTPQALVVPSWGMYLDAVLGGRELWPGDMPRYGDRYVATVSIEGFPSEGYPGVLDHLNEMDQPYRWSTRMIYLDQHAAIGELDRYRRKWRQKIKGFLAQVFKSDNGTINEDALLMTQEAEASMGDAHSGIVKFGYYSAVLVLMHEDQVTLAENARTLLRAIEQTGFAGRVETLNTMEAWLGSMPGNSYANVRRPMIHTLNLSDLLPLSTVWAGHDVAPCPFYPEKSPPLLHAKTAGATPFRLNLHYGDVGHTLILGPTGAGKSVLLAIIVAQFRRYARSTIACFDKGKSMYTLCRAAGGATYNVGVDADSPGFAPLSYLDEDGDMPWAAEWIATCYEMQVNKPLTPRQKEEVYRALVILRDETPKNKRSMTAFIASVQNSEVKEALKEFEITGPYGRLLDSEEDGVSESSFTVFEMEEFLKLSPRAVLPVLLYLFRRVERSLRGQPALIVLDEAWVMLGHEVFREKIREWLKVLRKRNCAVVMATQSISDATKSGIFDVLIESCASKILLPNPEATKEGSEREPGPADLYRRIGLNEAEIEMLSMAERKRQYYFISPDGRRLFELGLGPVARAFTTVSDPDTLREVDEMISHHGDDWQQVWLKEREVDYVLA